MKSEPETWSWEQQKKKKTEHWDGVRNYQAANYMKQMKIGDECLFYSSVKEKAIKGIIRVSKEYYPDHTDKKKIFGTSKMLEIIGQELSLKIYQE